MLRRNFIRNTLTLGALFPFRRLFAHPASYFFIGVNGPVNAARLGFILPHEHVLVDFVGASQIGPGRYDANTVAEQVLPLLVQSREAGCTAFFDCTPAYLGRDVALLRRLSDAARLPIITNTGYYSAVGHKYLPPHAHTETAEQIAQRWIDEYNHGIEDTGIRPGFIKISVNDFPLNELDQKIVQAAAIAHRATGLTIASHTSGGKAALTQLDILAEAGVAAHAFVWVHAQNETGRDYHREAAKRGAWVSFDNMGWVPVETFMGHIDFMQQAGLSGNLLVSHDAGWYDVESGGKKEMKPFTPVFTSLVPALREKGWTDKALKQLLHANPVAAFAVAVRINKKRR